MSTQTIAQYKGRDGNVRIFNALEGRDYIRHCGYIRVSEYMDARFVPLPDDVTVPAELERLDKAEAELRDKFQAALNQITTARNNLLALTQQVSA